MYDYEKRISEAMHEIDISLTENSVLFSMAYALGFMCAKVFSLHSGLSDAQKDAYRVSSSGLITYAYDKVAELKKNPPAALTAQSEDGDE